MNDLITAAKAVIERWENHLMVLDGTLIKNLRAAVGRAEKQQAVGYNEWTAHNSGRTVSPYELWTAAQQAERERCREIVIAMGGPDVPDLLRQIDSGED